MKLTILGSGTYYPEPDKATAGYLLEAGGKKIVFDMGRGVLNNLYKAGYKYSDIDAVAISHMCPDHFNDLNSYLQLLYAPPQEESKRDSIVSLIGSRGFRDNIESLLNSWNKRIDWDIINVQEIFGIKEIELGNSVLTGYETVHSASSQCMSYRLAHNGKTFAYSGDTTDSWGLRDAIRNSDLALIEATMPHSKLKNTRLSGYLAGKIAYHEGVKRLALTHVKSFYDNVVEEAKKEFNGAIILTNDLMEIDINAY